jgi:hypothetical protein
MGEWRENKAIINVSSQNENHNYNVNIGNRSTENAAKFKYPGTTPTD